MMAELLSNVVWEGLSSEMTDDLPGIKDGQFFKQLDTGESFFRRKGVWEFINLGLSFIKATKSGSITTDAGGNADVVFNTPFISDDYTVALTVSYPGSKIARLPYVSARTAQGFSIIVTDGKGDPIITPCTVSWVATRNYNP